VLCVSCGALQYRAVLCGFFTVPCGVWSVWRSKKLRVSYGARKESTPYATTFGAPPSGAVVSCEVRVNARVLQGAFLLGYYFKFDVRGLPTAAHGKKNIGMCR